MGTIKLGILIKQCWTKARKSLFFLGDPSHLQLAKPKNWCSKTYLSNNSSDRPDQLYKSGWVQSSTKRINFLWPKISQVFKKISHTTHKFRREKRSALLLYYITSLHSRYENASRHGYIYITSQTHMNDLDARPIL